VPFIANATDPNRSVDAKHKLIIEQEVTNQVVDMGLLTQTAEPARIAAQAMLRVGGERRR
jgi:hypothetical protein